MEQIILTKAVQEAQEQLLEEDIEKLALVWGAKITTDEDPDDNFPFFDQGKMN